MRQKEEQNLNSADASREKTELSSPSYKEKLDFSIRHLIDRPHYHRHRWSDY
jgi:hypothetical protein